MVADDGTRPKGSLPRLPKANAEILEGAIAARDVEIILRIQDTRGSNGASEEQLVEFLTDLCRNHLDTSTRQIKQEAKRRGFRADRGRIEKLREQLNLARDEKADRANRVEPLNYIDLAFVHLQAQVTVLGFAARGCDKCCERIGKIEKDEAPAPLIAPTSADRARLTNFSRVLIERRAALADQEPDWDLLLHDLAKVEGEVALIHVLASKDLLSHVHERLCSVAPVVAACDREWLLKELMRPELFFLGAG